MVYFDEGATEQPFWLAAVNFLWDSWLYWLLIAVVFLACWAKG